MSFFVLYKTSIDARNMIMYGINDDPVWNYTPEEIAFFVSLLKKSNGKSIRIPIRWSVVESSKGEFDFSKYDQVINMIPKDIEILAILMSVPQWANGVDHQSSKGHFDAYQPTNLKDWERYVTKTLEHFKDRITHWEIWNEPNGVEFYRPYPDARAYTELLRLSYMAAKRTSPQCLILLGGLQMNGIVSNPWSKEKITNYLEDLYKAGAKPYFDICNIHPYVFPKDGAKYMMKLTRDTLSLMERYDDGEKPIWITEIGYSATSKQDEVVQEQLLLDTIEVVKKEPRIQRLFWFLLRDVKKGSLPPECAMGLFSSNGEEKLALKAFRSITKGE